MLAIRRSETIQFGDFMSGGYKEKRTAKKKQIKRIVKATTMSTIAITAAKVAIPAMIVTIPIALMTRGLPNMAVEATATAVPVGIISDSVKTKIIHAFDPLVDLMVQLSYPISGLMITGGCLMILIGQKEHGYKLIFNAAIGFILIQLSPMLINLLYGIGSAI